jgi:acyl carrier protein
MGSKEKIRRYILKHVASPALEDDQDIFASELVGSMFVMQLVLFVEQEFGVSLDGSDLNFDFFRTVESVDALVARKLSA